MTMQDVIRAIDKMMAPLRRRVLLAIGRGILLATDDGKKIQIVQISGLNGEVLNDRERFQNYGLASHAHPGAEAIFVSVGGLRNHAIVLAVDDRRYRIVGLAQGEVALYTDENQSEDGHRIHLKRGGKIEVHCTDALVKAANVARMEGDVVEIHAKTRLHIDVNGYGEDWVHAAGAWHVDTWKTGNVVAGSENEIAPPEHPPIVGAP